MEISGRRIKERERNINVCDTCKERRSVTRATYGYCIECRYYLCEDCYHVHPGLPPCRNHRLLEGKHTPQERLPLVDVCEEHAGERIIYFCKEHSALTCQKCAFLKHKTCDNVRDISELPRDPKYAQYHKDLKKNVENLELRTEQNRKQREKNLSKIKENKKQTKADIKKFCTAMHERLHKLEQDANDHVDRLDEERNACMDKVHRESDSMCDDLIVVKTMLETSQDATQTGLSFIAMEKAKMMTDALDDKLEALCDVTTVREYKFEPNDCLRDLLTEVENLGVFVELAWNMDTVTAEEEDSINIRTETDNDTCQITGSMMMEGDTTLAVADYNNQSIKLVDVKKKKVVFQLRLSSSPWDITRVKDDRLAVALPAAHKIQFLSVTMGTSLSPGRQMDVLGRCRGIAYNNDRLIISFTDRKQVQILSMSGDVLNTISSQTDGQINFNYPHYLTLNEDRSLLYVSDWGSETVYCLDMNGAAKATYKNQGLNRPYGVCAAENGSVIVCGAYSHNVHVVSSDCSRGRVLLDHSCGLKFPESVTYSTARATLFIVQGYRDKSTLRVFKLR